MKFDSVKAVGKGDDDESEGTEGDNEFTIHPEEWTNKMGDTTVSSRVQIPLRLAWSISVHKVKGKKFRDFVFGYQFIQAYLIVH